jgi:ABC-type sugar transport system ATPase subunit
MRVEALRVEALSVLSPDGRQLRCIDLNVFAGETVGLMGLSESGPELLIEALRGLTSPFAGRILIGDQEALLGSEADSRSAGIYAISHARIVVESLTIAENIFILRRNGLKSFFLDRKAINGQASVLLRRLGLPFSPTTKAGALSPVERQLIELAKAIAGGARIVIFDTDFLEYEEKDLLRLGSMLRALKSEGIGFLIHCHDDRALHRLSDTIAIFRDGRIVKKMAARAMDHLGLEDYVVGRPARETPRADLSSLGEERFVVEGLHLPGSRCSFGFSLRRGEVLGLVAPDSQDLAYVFQALSGNRNDCSPSIIRLNGVLLRHANRSTLVAHKIVSVGDLGQTSSLFANMDIGENLLFPSLKKVAGVFGSIESRLAGLLAEHFVAGRSPPMVRVNDLSRADLTSLSLERWLVFRPEVILLIDPYRAADMEIGEIVSDYVSSFSRAGSSVLLLATRVDRLESMCHRLLSLSKDGTRGNL